MCKIFAKLQNSLYSYNNSNSIMLLMIAKITYSAAFHYLTFGLSYLIFHIGNISALQQISKVSGNMAFWCHCDFWKCSWRNANQRITVGFSMSESVL